MKTRSRNQLSTFQLRCLAVLLAAACLLILAAGAWAVMTTLSQNPGTSASASTLTLSSTSPATAMLSTAGMQPGSSVSKCINIRNAAGGAPAATLGLYGVVGGSGLATYLNVAVDSGSGATGGATFSCTGFTATTSNIITGLLSAFPTSGAPAIDGGGTLAPNASRSYRITLSLPSNVAVAAQNKNATISVSWVASS